MTKHPFVAVLAAAFGALCSYALKLVVPLCVLGFVMILDWATGMSKAYLNSEMNSRIGMAGILKKLGYLVVVGVAGVVDWLLLSGLHYVGIDAELPFLFAAIVVVWLIINELISILENIDAIGVPVPPFIMSLLNRLKDKVEDTAEDEDD